MYPELTIQSTEDWNTFAKPREKVELDIIVDPMIYRTADVFLRGKTGVGKTFGSSEQVRRAIKRNVDSIATFFDCFILSENLPIIDYGLTFDQNVASTLITSSRSAIKSSTCSFQSIYVVKPPGKLGKLRLSS